MGKIKGIDLYNKVLNNDESILGKVFKSGEDEIKIERNPIEMYFVNNKKPRQFYIVMISREKLKWFMSEAWEEVKQPVSPQEALKEWFMGKTIYSICPLGTKSIYSNENELLVDQNFKAISRSKMKEDKWYIED